MQHFTSGGVHASTDGGLEMIVTTLRERLFVDLLLGPVRAPSYIKHLMTGPKGNSEFCLPETLNVPRGEAEGNIEVRGEAKLTFSVGPVIKCFFYTSQLKIEQYTDFYTEFAAVSKVHLLIPCESKVQVIVSLGS